MRSRKIWPTMNGNSNCSAILPTEPHVMVTEPSVVISANTSSGVMKTPSRFDTDADTTAALTWPRAMATNVIDDCTVDGTSVRNRKPAASEAPRTGASSHWPSRPSSGNRMNVAPSTIE